MIASLQKGGGTNMIDASAPVYLTASLQSLNIGSPR